MNRVFGKVFVNSSDEEYGIIGKADEPYPVELQHKKIIAEDECGNYFILFEGDILFWDHETSEFKVLSCSLQEFVSGCKEPESAELNSSQVISSWIDPEFAKKHGVKS